MASFIFEVLKNLKDKGYDLTSLNYILPSKRAGLFLKQELVKLLDQTVFAPEIITIENFVEELSQLKVESNTELLFHLYSSYLSVEKSQSPESFHDFLKWGQLLLQDFNEIDRYLIPYNKLFDYLGAIQELNHWSKADEKTEIVSKYLLFWQSLPTLYNSFQERLLGLGIAYQGLIYREALENLETYLQNTKRKKHVFIGFNALNKAEETIIQELLKNNMADIYWDADESFVNNPIHEAGLFLRMYKSQWNFFQSNPFHWVESHYSTKKNVSVYGVPKNVSQAKQIGTLLENLVQTNGHIEKTALVLADESLLVPVLNSIPKSVKNINITMGLPLRNVPLLSLFEQLLKFHTKQSQSYYYKEIIALLSHSQIRSLLFDKIDKASLMIETIEANNFIYLDIVKIKSLIEDASGDLINLLFSDWENDPLKAIEHCQSLIFKIKLDLETNKNINALQLEYLYRFNSAFNELKRLIETYGHINDIKTLHIFFNELLKNETLDFQGEPLEGLQIMGMLESRVLDFETVIIASVNEGILPSGKTNSSFIPYDVKLEYGLPTYKEKDAVYAYHFYHLLHRAKNIHILYNSEVDTLNGGEKSRFITQLEVENIHKINHQIIIPKTPIYESSPKVIAKSNSVIKELRLLADKGFSPSSLTSYIRNPIDFYNQKILGIKEYEEVEETVADNTLGTIVHNTLEDFYKPFVGKLIKEKDINSFFPKIDETVRHHFKLVFKSGDITKGKNLIIFEVAKRYIFNFLKVELEQLKTGIENEVLGIENDLETSIEIPELGFPIKIKGKIDRIDRYNGSIRVIDYKTGKVEPNQVQLVNWEDILSDYKKYSKSFQVLTYSFLLQKNNLISLPIEAGIISFKNISNGFMPFAKKDKEGNGAIKDTLISDEVLYKFHEQLKLLLLEIFNPDIPFVEKEV